MISFLVGESFVGKLGDFSHVFGNADHTILLKIIDKYGKRCKYNVPCIVRSETRNRILNVNAVMNVYAVIFLIYSETR